MAGSILSSIIFFLLFIVLSHFVDAHREHRKLCGAKETMSMRRNLEGKWGSKIKASPSSSYRSGQKNTQHEPSKTHPDQATHQGQTAYISSTELQRQPTQRKCTSGRCKREVIP
ncbi:hypothetical protein Bca52824_011969 [Brassica carinata]|uniref:Transmembrane protein n=1 Tax=Brassica carinata TaxID=52824 RepID=A0A8X7VW04_BRACI|nr:hypothetical protein Bca52824_011969 [Brassica carinata]